MTRLVSIVGVLGVTGVRASPTLESRLDITCTITTDSTRSCIRRAATPRADPNRATWRSTLDCQFSASASQVRPRRRQIASTSICRSCLPRTSPRRSSFDKYPTRCTASNIRLIFASYPDSKQRYCMRMHATNFTTYLLNVCSMPCDFFFQQLFIWVWTKFFACQLTYKQFLFLFLFVNYILFQSCYTFQTNSLRRKINKTFHCIY